MKKDGKGKETPAVLATYDAPELLCKFTIRGKTALLMDAGERAKNVLDPLTIRHAELTHGKHKGLPDVMAQARQIELELSCYVDAEQRVVLPSVNLQTCIREGASLLAKGGQSVERGLLVMGDPPLLVDGKVLTVQDILERPICQYHSFVRRGTGSGKSKPSILIARPVFGPGWEATFELSLQPGVISPEQAKAFIAASGALIGLGNWRPRYGRFVLVSFEIVGRLIDTIAA
jgi:hypothetical protein